MLRGRKTNWFKSDLSSVTALLFSLLLPSKEETFEMHLGSPSFNVPFARILIPASLSWPLEPECDVVFEKLYFSVPKNQTFLTYAIFLLLFISCTMFQPHHCNCRQSLPLKEAIVFAMLDVKVAKINLHCKLLCKIPLMGTADSTCYNCRGFSNNSLVNKQRGLDLFKMVISYSKLQQTQTSY